MVQPDEQRLMEVAEYIARRTSSGEHRRLVLYQLAHHVAYERHRHSRLSDAGPRILSDAKLLIRQMRLRGYLEPDASV